MALSCCEKLFKLKSDSFDINILYTRCLGYSGKFQESLEILEDLLSQTSMKSNQIIKACTIFLDFSKRFAEDTIKIKKDLTQMNLLYYKSFDHFINCVNKGDYDQKLVDEFVESFYQFMIVNKSNSNDKKAVMSIYEKVKDFIKTSNPNYKFKINMLLENYYLNDSKRYEGKIINIDRQSGFAFISHEDRRIYANRAAFGRDWNKVDVGYKVEFSFGTNTQGECAINALLLN